MRKRELERFIENHPVGFCKVPKQMDSMPFMGAPKTFMAPSYLDNRNYCTPTEDQGTKPWCAAYAAANWAESVLWKKNGYIEQIDPGMLYKWAKQHDGDPNGSGTSLDAVLRALLAYRYFDDNVCKVNIIRPGRLAFKHAMHKFGCVLAGFNISSAWWGASKSKPVISSGGDHDLGGHAVILAGYDKQGVHIFNSWGPGWGEYGFGKITWAEFDRQIIYGAVLTNCLDGLHM